MKQIDGTKTLAVDWPKGSLTYMSGDITNLETELLIAFDLLAHAIQKALNCHNIQDDRHPTDRYNKPELAIESFQIDSDAKITYPGEIDDGMPHMGTPFSVYHKKVLHSYNDLQEENRKY